MSGNSRTDRRKFRRHKVLKEGQIVSFDFGSAVDVIIRDMSVGGARICTAASIDFTESFTLVVTPEELLYPAIGRWRIGQSIGIEFVGEPRHRAALVESVVNPFALFQAKRARQSCG